MISLLTAIIFAAKRDSKHVVPVFLFLGILELLNEAAIILAIGYQMEDFTCWENGLFFYYPLYAEIQSFRLEVEDMDDANLVDEVAYICEDDDEIDSILYDFVIVPRLTEKQREKLINFYILCNIQNCLMILEDGTF